jgi:hypothetical protein
MSLDQLVHKVPFVSSSNKDDERTVLLHTNIVNVEYNLFALSNGKNNILKGLDIGDAAFHTKSNKAKERNC